LSRVTIALVGDVLCRQCYYLHSAFRAFGIPAEDAFGPFGIQTPSRFEAR